MNRYTRIAVIPLASVWASLLLFSAGCGGGGGNNAGPPAESQGTISGKLATQAVYLSWRSDTPTAVTASSVTIPGNRPDIKAGTVLISSIGSGFIRNVTSVSSTGGSTVCQTTQGGLADAFSSLHAQALPKFDQATIGNISTGVPGFTCNWVSAPGSKAATTRAGGAGNNTLELGFNNLGLSGGGQGSFSVSGTIDFQATSELDMDVGIPSGSIFPVVTDFNSSINSTMTGTVVLAASGSGTLGVNHKWVDSLPVGPPIPVGWLVFQNFLTVESDLTGEASGDISHSQTVNVTAGAGVSYSSASGWTSSGSLTPSLGATETNVDAEFSLALVPVKVTLECKLYALVGPYIALDANITGKGVLQQGTDPATGNQVEGVQATVTGGLEGEAGISAGLPDYVAELLDLKSLGVTVPLWKQDLVSTTLFSQFFPLQGSEITILDNGDSTDNEDQFLVTLDGGTLDYVPKGSTGTFPLNNLVPGNHTISVTYTDLGADGETGDPPASLQINLADGLTFPDGSTTISQSTLPFDVAQTFTIVVPAKSKSVHQIKPLRVVVKRPKR